MKKLLILFLMSSVFLFATERLAEEKTYLSVEKFYEELEAGKVFRRMTPYYDRREVDGYIVESILYKLEAIYTDAIVDGIVFHDEVLREIAFQSSYRKIPVRLIPTMIIANLTKTPTREDVRDYSLWYYRLRALGVPQSKIMKRVKQIPKNFFRGQDI